MSAPVRVTFTPEPSGWATCELSIGDASHRMPSVSDTTHPLGDLVRAALLIATGQPQATVSFDAEPIETRWLLDTGWVADDRLVLGFRVRLLEFAAIYRQQPDEEGVEVFCAETDADAFVRAVLLEAERLMQPDQESWLTRHPLDGANPKAAIAALHAALAV